MNLITFLFGQSEHRALKQPPDDDDFWYNKLFGSGSRSYDPEKAMRVTAIYSCVRILAESVASLPLHIYRELPGGGKDRVTKDRVATLFNRQPNPWQHRMGFFEMLMGHVLLRGNAFARKIRNRQGDILMLVPMDPTRMSVSQEKNAAITYSYKLNNGTEEKFDSSEIVHFQGMSSDGLIGLSPLEILSRLVAFTDATEEYGTAFFENYAQLGMVFKHPGRLGETARKNLVGSIRDAHVGPNKAFKTFVLEENMTWDSIGAPTKDIEFVNIRKMNRSEIAGAFRVPPHMIGDLENATYSNIEQQSIDFVVNTLRPWLIRFELTLWRDVLSEIDESYFAEFKVDGLLRGDVTARSAAYQSALMNGYMNIDEVRELENRNPLPDGLGQVYRVPLNLVEVGKEPVTTDQTNAPATSPDPNLSPSTGDNNNLKTARELLHEVYARAIRREQKIDRSQPDKVTKHEAYLIEAMRTPLKVYAQALTTRCPTDQELDGILNLFIREDTDTSSRWSELFDKPEYVDKKIDSLRWSIGEIVQHVVNGKDLK